MVEVLEKAKKQVRCDCGALLRYDMQDVHQPPAIGKVVTNFGAWRDWPWIECPECHRAVLVSGCW